MICQGCGQEVEPNDLHTYYDCLLWVRLHPEDEQKVTLKRMYYGKVSIVTEKTERSTAMDSDIARAMKEMGCVEKHQGDKI